MRSQYQFGSLYLESRKNGPDVWVYHWRESTLDWTRQLRKRIVGSILDLLTQAEAQKSIEAFHVNVNKQAANDATKPRTIAKLVEHYRSISSSKWQKERILLFFSWVGVCSVEAWRYSSCF
jgi:integrase